MADENDPCPCGSRRQFKDCHLHDPSLALAIGVDAEMNEIGARCIRRMLFLTGADGYEIAGEGTCFLVKADGALWIATAKHVLRGI